MAFDKELGYDPAELIEVIVEDTKVETVVSRAYYEQYKTEGIRMLQLHNPKPAPKVNKKAAAKEA